MTLQATMWAMALRDISPVAKLVAIYISDNFDETTGCASRPLSLEKIAEVEQMDDEFICARLPVKS
jgi:hypothetical protein